MRTGKIPMTALWLTILLLVSLFPISVFAADTGTSDDTVRVEIPVSCTGKNTSESFEYRLSFEPVESQKIENDTLSLKDGKEGSFAVTYDQPGTYHYTVSQKKGTDKKTHYDSRVYQIDVYVTEDEDGRLSAEVIAYLQGDTAKKEKLDFFNEKQLPEKEPEKHPGTGGGKEPVQTGDHMKSGWFTVMTCSGAAFAGLAVINKRRKAV